MFYKAGFECQLLLNASGYGWQQKCDLFEAQVRLQLGAKTLERLDILEFQLYEFLSLARIRFRLLTCGIVSVFLLPTLKIKIVVLCTYDWLLNQKILKLL